MIRVEPLDNIAIIRLDREAKKNAMTPKMLESLIGAVDRANSARAIVLSGVGGVFCSGFDLTLCKDDPTVLKDLLTGLSRAIVALRASACCVVASAHGAAIAGGCALLGGADFVITNAEAKLGYPVVRLGISPAVSAPFLRQGIGDGACRGRLLEPNLIDGREALRIGLASECVSNAAECEPRAIVLARELAAKPAHAIGHTKAWLARIAPVEHASEAMEVSLGLVGTAEERERLTQVWSKG